MLENLTASYLATYCSLYIFCHQSLCEVLAEGTWGEAYHQDSKQGDVLGHLLGEQSLMMD